MHHLKVSTKTLLCLAIVTAMAGAAFAQPVTLPRQSPHAVVQQTIGLSDVVIDYHRPQVNGREVWGGLVPYGQVWRAGANENTTITFSHDVQVEGKPLAAGTYGLHLLPNEDEVQVIFSNNSTSWGSFSYQESEDALRVSVKPEAGDHVEALTYSFADLDNDSAVVELAWAEKRVPFEVAFDTHAIVVANSKNELRSLPGFGWQGPLSAANYLMTNSLDMEQAMQWIDQSIQAESRFENLSIKSQLLAQEGDAEQADQLMAQALEKANPGQLHTYGRQLLGQGKTDEAVEIFELNAKKHPETWFVHVGLARGHDAAGNQSAALAAMKKAHEECPDPQKAYIAGLVSQLEDGTSIN